MSKRIKLLSQNRLFYGVFVASTLIFLCTRLYQLNLNPPGLHVDEAGMAYDAWSIAKYGVDRYLISFPVYFINFGGGQNALYTYLTALLFKCFGFSYNLIRVPAFINSMITFVFGFKLSELYFGKKSIYASFVAFLIAVTPFFIMSSRIGLESYLMTGTTVLMLYVLTKAVLRSSLKLFILAGILSGLILYTYAISYLVLPLFILLFMIYLIWMKKVKVKYVIAFSIPLFLLALPLLTLIYINTFNLNSIKIGLISIPRLTEYRSAEITFSYLAQNLVNTIKVTLFYDWLPYNSLPQFYTLYWISIPFILIGLFKRSIDMFTHLRDKTFSTIDLLVLFTLAMVLVSLTLGGNGPNVNKLNALFFPLVVFSVLGIRSFNQFIVKKVPQVLKLANLSTVVVIALYLYSFMSFARYYFNEYPNSMKHPVIEETNSVNLFAPVYDDVLEYINTHSELQSRIVYFENSYYQGYIYYLLSSRLDPFIFNINQNSTGNYQLFYFALPDHYFDSQSVYVVGKLNMAYINEIEATGIYQRLEFKEHYIYY